MTNNNYTVFFVDDEYLVRNLLKKCVDWNQLGIDIVGESDGSRQTICQIKAVKPDIVFLDVCMPIIDGCEIAAQIAKELPSTYIVMLTGHREFKYAQEAIKIGVYDYLLKPINPKEIISITQKITEDIQKKREKDSEYKEMKKRMCEDYPYLKERFLNQLVEGTETESQRNKLLTYYSIPLSCTCFGMAIIHIANHDFTSKGKDGDVLLGLKKDFISYSNNMKNIECFINNKNLIVLNYNCHILLTKFMEQFIRFFYEKKEVKLTVGVSNIFHHIENIQDAYKQAVSALNQRIIFGTGIVIPYKNANSQNNDIINYDRQMAELRKYIKLGLTHDAINLIRTILNSFVSQAITDVNQMRAFGIRVVSECVSLYNGMESNKLIDQKIHEQMINRLFEFETVIEMEEYLTHYIRKITTIISGVEKIESHSVVGKVKEYIDTHLADYDLSLQKVANLYYVNASYLSRIYKSETGTSFVEYVNKKRIEKAIQILRSEDCKSYEIAKRVGIEDPHYFGMLFKKSTGLTIMEYKQALKRGEK